MHRHEKVMTYINVTISYSFIYMICIYMCVCINDMFIYVVIYIYNIYICLIIMEILCL